MGCVGVCRGGRGVGHRAVQNVYRKRARRSATPLYILRADVCSASGRRGRVGTSRYILYYDSYAFAFLRTFMRRDGGKLYYILS